MRENREGPRPGGPSPTRLQTLGLPVVALAVLLAGLALRGAGLSLASSRVWTVGLYLVGVPLVLRAILGLLRGRFAADLVASLALVTAMALNQPLAGLLVALMQTGGEALERYAERRASRAVEELEAQAPRIAHRKVGERIEDLPVEGITPGDEVVVRPGEMVPCDGVVIEGVAAVDVSRITGEPIPLTGRAGVQLASGSLVLDGPLVLRVVATARESLYARVVELVRTAQAHKAPLQRAADRAAMWFTPLTLLVCVAAWAVSGDPVRVLAVLVVATPCPMILATPVAIVGGINRAARLGIIVRHGGALEALGQVTVVAFDKTGTLTLGQPEVARVTPLGGASESEVLQLTASVERDAGHPLARSLVREALRAGLTLAPAEGVREWPGQGVAGVVAGVRVTVGALSLIREAEPAAVAALLKARDGEPGLAAAVVVDGKAAAWVMFADRPRTGALEALGRLRALGLTRQVLLSGDDQASVESVAGALGLEEAAGDLRPEEKARYVTRLQSEGDRVLMVGDGINDAPALSTAAVGMALAAHGGGIAAESADVVLLDPAPERVVESVEIGRRTMRIARQSLGVGLGLSLVAMGVAALGYLPPVAGALLQEGIDLAVILNALRSATPGGRLAGAGGPAIT